MYFFPVSDARTFVLKKLYSHQQAKAQCMRHYLKWMLLALLGWAFSPAQAQIADGCAGLRLTSVGGAQAGDTVTLYLQAHDLEGLTGLQYTHTWNPARLRFLSMIENSALSFTTASINADPTLLSQGRLPLVWFDPMATGYTPAPGENLYGLRFVVLDVSQPARVSLGGAPTPVEIVYSDGQTFESYWLGEAVVGGAQGYPALTEGCIEGKACGNVQSGRIYGLGGTGVEPWTYQWQGPSMFNSTADSITHLQAGVYQLTATDALGQSGYASFRVANDPALNLSVAGVAASCGQNNGSATALAAGAPGPVTFVWSNGATGSSISGLAPGVYTVTATDPLSGCSATAALEIGTDFDPVTGAGVGSVDCEAGSTSGAIALSVAPGSYTFAWSNGSTAQNLNNLAPGSYTVTVTDPANGCWAAYTYEVPAESEVIIGVSYNCGQDGSAELSALVWNNIAPPYTFQWSTGATTVAELLSTITAPQSGVYAVTITGSNGCSGVAADIAVDCQPEPQGLHLSLTPALTAANNGDQVCMTARVENFDQLNGFQFSLQWNPQLLSYSSLSHITLPGLSPSSFNLQPSLLSTGRASVVWVAPNVGSGETLPDGAVLFQLCFTVVGTEGIANVGLGQTPTPPEAVSLQGEVLPLTLTPGQVSIQSAGGGDEPVRFYGAALTGSVGAQVCMPVRADDFTGVAGIQFSLRWQPDKLQFAGVQNITLPNATQANNFGLLNESLVDGALRFIWFDNGVSGYNLPDGATLFEVCFLPLEPGVHPVAFGSAPIPAIASSSLGEALPSSTYNGAITIGNQPNPQAWLEVSSTAVAPGETACVDVTALRFAGISSFQFSLNWDNEVMQFSHLEPLAGLPDFSPANYNAGAGFLTTSYLTTQPQGLVLTPETPLFRLCFNTNTEGSTPVFFSSQPTLIEFIDAGLMPATTRFEAGQVVATTDEQVWPGDTNHDGQANHFDLLNVGLGYGFEGSARFGASNQWHAQYAPAWATGAPATGTNYRHADANGDGAINAADTLAIQLNWGQTTPLWIPGEEEFRSLTGAPMYVQTDTVNGGETVYFPIVLGESEAPVQAYGIAFSIVYDPAAVVPGSVGITAGENGWMGQAGVDLLALYRDFTGDSRVDVALTRIDGLNATGQGPIAELKITLEDVIFQRGGARYEMPVRIENVRLINASEVEQPVAPRETVALIDNVTATGEAEALPALRIAPVPTAEWIQVDAADASIGRIEVLATDGRLLGELPAQERISLGAYPAGVYWLRIITDQGVALRKAIKL